MSKYQIKTDVNGNVLEWGAVREIADGYTEVTEEQLPGPLEHCKLVNGNIVIDSALVAADTDTKEADVLIAKEIKDLAIASLKSKNELDADGKVVK